MVLFKIIKPTPDEAQAQFNNLIDEILRMQKKLDVLGNKLDDLLKR